MFDWFWEFLYRLLKTLLYCIDFILSFAKQLVGVKPIYDEQNNEVELFSHFFNSSAIQDAFKLVAIIGLVLLFLFTVVAVMRAIARMGEGKTPLGVCASAGKAMLYFLLIPGIMYFCGIFISAVMTALYDATSLGSGGLGSSLFTLFADEAYNGGGNKEGVLELFRISGPFAEDAAAGYNYNSMGNVKNYFSLSKINYFLGFVAGSAVLILLIKPLMSFVERIVSLLLLFVVSPISVASSVLDDGARFKLWRDQVINKFLVAYGSLLSLNIFTLMIQVIYTLTFFPDSSFLNGLARLLFVLGGASACRMGAVLIGNLVNSGAGSQYAQDAQNVSSPLSTLAHAGIASRVVGGIANRASRTLNRKLSPSVHRKSNAKNEVKDKMAQQKYEAKLAKRSSSGSKSGGADGGKGGGAGRQRDIKDALIGAHRAPKESGGGDAGGEGGGGWKAGQVPNTDKSANRASAATVKDAMKSGKTDKGQSKPKG